MVAVPEYLGILWKACYKAFYQRIADHDRLHLSIQRMMTMLKNDIGARLYATINDVTLVGLGLHPVFKAIAEPPNFPNNVFLEREMGGILPPSFVVGCRIA